MRMGSLFESSSSTGFFLISSHWVFFFLHRRLWLLYLIVKFRILHFCRADIVTVYVVKCAIQIKFEWNLCLRRFLCMCIVLHSTECWSIRKKKLALIITRPLHLIYLAFWLINNEKYSFRNDMSWFCKGWGVDFGCSTDTVNLLTYFLSSPVSLYDAKSEAAHKQQGRSFISIQITW